MKQEKARALIDAALDRLGDALERGTSDTMKAYLAAMARFRQYSWGNVLLIASQRPGATHIAGYRAWQKLERQVNHGEKGIVIMAPIVKRHESVATEEEQRRHEDAIWGFKTAHVFDINQTSGKPLPKAAQVEGDPKTHLSGLKRLVERSGIKLVYSDSIGRAEGLSTGGMIVVRNGLSPAEELSVIVHEFAHELLHRGGEKLPQTVRETEAEAVAYVVCEALGLDTNTASSDYIRTWQGTRETLAASLERIHRTATRILDGMAVEEGGEADSHEGDVATEAAGVAG